ncbi:MAG: TonB-dependent receptor [Rhizomicrobium sp.]|nr:TonB-dependent receptor [Rhizomicrobium sp.]
MFAPDAVRDRNAAAINGSMSAYDAIRRLLSGSDLQIVRDSSGGLIVRQVQQEPAQSPSSTPPPVVQSLSMGGETIIVTGIRGSLQRNLDIKRAAYGLIDAITMEDVGRFPDANLATALMRIPGVTVSRAVTSLSGISSSTGEPTQITVRGFGPSFNETLFEGRKISSGISFRGFDFSALNSDLVQEVDVLKSPDPSLSAGAIGATLNIKYPRPLDKPGLRATVSASTTYNPEEGRPTPNFNVLFSDSIANNRLGFLVAAAYAETKSRSNEATVWGWEGAYLDSCQFAGAANPCGNVFVPDTTRPVWYIQDYGIYQIHNWQMRENAVAVLQWQPNDAVHATLNGTFARNDLKELQNGYAIWNSGSEMRNVKTSVDGTIIDFTRANTPTDFDAQFNEQVLQNYDLGLNVKWVVNSSLSVLVDGDIALSSLNPGGQYGDFSVDTGYGPSTPTGTNGSNIGITVAPGGNHVLPYYTSYGPNGDASRFLDTSIIGSHVIVLISQRNRNITNQAKLQADWSDGDLHLTAGVQYLANHIKLSAYQSFANNQWQAFAGYGPASNNYYQTGPAAGLPAGVALPPSLFTKSFSTENFIAGWQGSGALPPRVISFDPRAAMRYLEQLGDPVSPTTIPGFNYGCCDPAYHGRFSVSPDPASYLHIFEDNVAGYLLLAGMTNLGGMPLQYHAGMRAEYTALSSTGIGQLPTSLSVMSADHTAFLVTYGNQELVTSKRGYHYFLPNADLNLEISENLQLRLDASRTLTRPPFAALTPVQNFSSSERVGSLVATGGNPGLRPFLSNNFDISSEWYYASNSYVSANAFVKNVTNFIVSGTLAQTINAVIDPTTGRPAQFRVSSYVNGPSASVYGVEIALQHVWDDTGFGFQANGTLVGSNKPYDPHNLTTSGFAVTGLADSANLIAFYDKSGFEIRVAANWRDSYLDHFGQQQNYSAFNAEPTYVDSSWNMDISSSYALTDALTAYGEVLNVLNTTYSTRGRFAEQMLDAVDYGRRITLGLRYTL